MVHRTARYAPTNHPAPGAIRCGSRGWRCPTRRRARWSLWDGFEAAGPVAADALAFDAGEQHAQIRAVGELGDHVQLQGGLHPPQQLRAGVGGLVPECSAVEPAVGQHQHVRLKAGQQWAGELALVDEDTTEVRVDHGVGAAFAQAEHLHLRVGGIQAEADAATGAVSP
jgi:hypothetical protein